MSNNGNGFWVIIALIAALSLVAIFDAAIAALGALMSALAGLLAKPLGRALSHRRFARKARPAI
jgi:hypothetical protein